MDIDWFKYIKENIVGIIFAFLSMSCLIFLVARELTLWYFKINRMESLLESIDSKLGEIISNKTDEKPTIVGAITKDIEPEVCSTTDGLNHGVGDDKLQDTPNIETYSMDVLKKDGPGPFLEKLTNVLTKEYYILDLFSSNKKEKPKE